MTRAPDLHLSSDVIRRLHAAGRASHDAEPCGFLIGRRAPSGALVVDEISVEQNQHPQPRTGFHMSPDVHLRARAAARHRSREVLGTWHGHLFGPLELGEGDRRLLTEGPYRYMVLIAAGQTKRPRLATWYVSPDGSPQELVADATAT